MSTNRTTDESLDGIQSRDNLFEVDLTAVRLHGYALRRWFYRNFLLREGMPVPVVYAFPVDAFSEFNRLFTQTNSYDYLKTASPHVWPVNTQTPLISFAFTGDHHRPDMSSSNRVNRTYSWLTAGPTEGVGMNQLASVKQVRYSAGADFNFQVDFWCQRPDISAVFYEQLGQAFRVGAGSVRQSWVTVPYPVTHGTQTVRLVQTSDAVMVQETSAAPADGIVLYHTSFTVTIEGYYADRSSIIVPALWYATLSIDNPSLNALDEIYRLSHTDLRTFGTNPVLALRSHLPSGSGSLTA